jgi:anti-anti-sigma factor
MSLTIDLQNPTSNSIKVNLIGRLDTNTSPKLEEMLDVTLTKNIKMLTLDMSQLEYISSAGLRVLFKASKTLKGQDGQLAMMHLQPQIQKVLDIVKALPSVPIFKDDEEMDDYFDAMQKKILDGDD